VGSSYIHTYYYQDSGWRVSVLGGYANTGAAAAGFFAWSLSSDSSPASMGVGGRVCF